MLSITAFADNAGFRNDKGAAFPSVAPYESKYTEIKWTLPEGENIGAPVAYAESVIIPSGSSVLRLAEDSGAQLAEIKLSDPICKDYSGAMLGTILIQPTESGVTVIDFTDGSITAEKRFDGKIGSDCAIIDNLAYFSVANDSGETLYCADLSNKLETLWEYKSDSDITSLTVQGDYVVFGAGENIVTHHYKESAVCKIPVGSEVTEAPFASQYAIFFTDNSGNAGKLRLNSDGTMEEDSLVRCVVGGSPSAPLYWNNRLYVGSETGFHVMDSINMEINRTFEEAKNGTTPFVCYGSGARIYTIAEYDENRRALHCITDFGEDSTPTDAILALMDKFSDGSYTVSRNGTVYVRDSIGRVFALKKVEYDILTMVVKLIILLALIVGVFIWLRMIKKRREANTPKY